MNEIYNLGLSETNFIKNIGTVPKNTRVILKKKQLINIPGTQVL